MPLKKCSKCQIHKDISQFCVDNSKPDGLYPSCNSCRAIQSKVYYAEHGHKDRKRNKKRRRDNRDYIYDILADSCCVSCGESDIWLLEFDHIDPTTKTANISQMSGWSIENIDKEIEKCNVMCTKCHRQKTAQEFDWYLLEYLEKRNKK